MKQYYNYNKVVEEKNIEVLLVSRVSLNSKICTAEILNWINLLQIKYVLSQK